MPASYAPLILIVVLGSVFPSPAFSQGTPEPLSPAEIQEADDLAKSPLWRAQMDKGGRQFLVRSSLDARTVADILDYLNSACLSTQLAILTNHQVAASSIFDWMRHVGNDLGGAEGYFQVTDKSGYKYRLILQKTSTKTEGCGFKLLRYQSPSENFPPVRTVVITKEAGATAAWMWGLSFICLLGAIILPSIAQLINARIAATTAGVLATVGTLLAIMTDQEQIGANIRIDLILFLFLLPIAWLRFFGLISKAFRRMQDDAGNGGASMVVGIPVRMVQTVLRIAYFLLCAVILYLVVYFTLVAAGIIG